MMIKVVKKLKLGGLAVALILTIPLKMSTFIGIATN